MPRISEDANIDTIDEKWKQNRTKEVVKIYSQAVLHLKS